MKKSARGWVGAAVMTVGVLAGATQGAADTLEEALAAAYNTNPTLLADRARQRATDEGVPQAKSAWVPTVTFDASYQFTNSRRQSALSFFGTSTPPITTRVYTEAYGASLTAQQTLFQGFRNFNALRAAKARRREGVNVLTATEQSVLLSAVTAYTDVIRDAATVELNENNVQVLKRQLEASEDRFRVGEITRTDVAQSEARLSLSQSDRTNAQATLAESRARYEAIIGNPPGSLDPDPRMPELPGSLEEAIALALEANPDLLAAVEAEKAARFDVAQAKGGLLPTISLQARGQLSEDTNRANNQSSSTSFVSSFTMPIYQGGRQFSVIRQTKHLASQARIRVAEIRRRIIQDTTNAWENLLAARARIVSDQQQVRANEIAFEGVQQEAQVGSRTTLDVLDAEQELLNARVSLVRSERDEYVAAYGLLSAMGFLTAQGLGLPVEIYDPERNYRSVRWKLIGYGTTTD